MKLGKYGKQETNSEGARVKKKFKVSEDLFGRGKTGRRDQKPGLIQNHRKKGGIK